MQKPTQMYWKRLRRQLLSWDEVIASARAAWAKLAQLRARSGRAVLIVGLLSLFALMVEAAIFGVPPGIFLRGIASGPIPPAIGWGVAGMIVGIVVHFTLIAAMATVLIGLSDKYILMREEWLSAGLAYGVGTWVVMDLVVLPIRWPTIYPVLTPLAVGIQLTSHILFVGLPIAYLAQQKRSVAEAARLRMPERSDAERCDNTEQTPVGVIVPMYNAAATIDATLRSIVTQTYRALEIVIVDDGSTDRSPDIAASWAARDHRIRVVRQPNAGVAAARNRGAAESTCPFLAFIDADDLWAPQKIAAQMAMMNASEPDCGLIYCWSAGIDPAGRVFSEGEQPLYEGHVLGELCRRNFVKNGSAMLVTRAAFEQVGGFDPSLNAARAQGCEDLLFALSVAEHHAFRAIPRSLVGYRMGHRSMSSDTRQMQRSFDMVAERFRQRLPRHAGELDAHRADYLGWLFGVALSAGNGAAVVLHARALGNISRRRLLATIADVTWGQTQLFLARATAWARPVRHLRPRYEECEW